MDENNEYSENIVEEGLVKIKFPEYEKVSSSAPVFYNPRMEFNRDNSILAIQSFQKLVNREISICDLFSGSGIRGVRYKKEISGVDCVGVNDINPLANKYCEINSELNDVSVRVSCEEASFHLRSNRGKYDVIDIDPFGTPSFFLDSASYSIKKDGLLCLTATDTSALCGTYTSPCIRKYNAKPYKSEYCHENGVRILIGFAALTLAKYKKYVEVLMSHSSEHYMRAYLHVKKGSKNTDDSLKENIGHILHCKNCLHHEVSYGLTSSLNDTCPYCGGKFSIAGPLWIGNIQDKDFIGEMINICDSKQLNTKGELLKLLESCYNEAGTPIGFYDIHVICKNLKISAPKLDKILESLNNQGYIAIRTHFKPLGVKTDADINTIKETILNLVN